MFKTNNQTNKQTKLIFSALEDFENKIDSIAGNVDRDPESWISKLYLNLNLNGGSENQDDPSLIGSQNEDPSLIGSQNEDPSLIGSQTEDPSGNENPLRFGSDYPLGSEEGLESPILDESNWSFSDQSNSTGKKVKINFVQLFSGNKVLIKTKVDKKINKIKN